MEEEEEVVVAEVVGGRREGGRGGEAVGAGQEDTWAWEVGGVLCPLASSYASVLEY